MNLLKPSVSPITGRTGLLLALGAAVCFYVAYAPIEFGPLRLFSFAYIAFLVQLARLKTTRRSFYAGLVTGLICVAPQLACFWSIFGPAAVPLWVIVAFWIGLFVALTHVVLTRLGTRWALLLTPFLWTGLEYFRSELYYLKFSWMNVGYAFAPWQPCPLHITGMYGVGFLAAMIAVMTVVTRRLCWTIATITLLVGGLLANSTALTTSPKHGLRIAGIQMEFPAEREVPAALDQLLAAHPEADLLVLSEYTFDGPVPESVKQWCKHNQRSLIAGGKDPAPGGNFYDTGFVIGPDGDIVFRQAKSVPIQFFKDGLPAAEQAVWNSPWGKIGICICYDLSYTRVTDRLVKLGAQLLIVPTMDVVDWGKRQHELHALVAPVRAAEYGLPIFRLASSGISQAVDRHGRVVAQASFPGEKEILFAQLPLSKAGSLPVDRILAPVSVGITLLTIVALVCVRWANRKRETIASAAQRLAKTIAVTSAS